MKKMPEQRPQAKVKQQNHTDATVIRVGSTVPTFAEIGLSGKGMKPPRDGAKRHPQLGVVADDSNDELFCEWAKNIRESCIKEKSWHL